MINGFLQTWEAHTNYLARHFALKYFGKDKEDWWVADEIGGVYHINDYFFNLDTMVQFLKHNYSVKKMFEYYDYQLKCIEDKKIPICIRDYKKLK
jgi:hypothetical protein